MFRLKSYVVMIILTLSCHGFASTIAIIDSGTDMLHYDIEPQAWVNPHEIPGNDRDEDRNGFQDDVHGWNFAEGNPQVIDYSYLGTLNEDIRKFFAIQSKLLAGEHSEEELEWAREMVKDEDFLKRITIYGNFMHGTHVAGIALSQAQQAKLMAVKLIPTEVKLPFFVMPHAKSRGLWLLKKGLAFLASQQVNQFREIIHYVDSHNMDVANGSFGTGYPQAKMIVENLAKVVFKSITPEQLDEAVKHFLNTLIQEGLEPFAQADKTLFVFAAGNDGLDNDEYPIYPTNLQNDNIISVAASYNYNSLAAFSNYGQAMVDVAAPGVNIVSAAPGNQKIGVSGTSQAAPFVAGIAAQIKDENPSLTPKEIKELLMGTVDRKDWLQGKVVSGGVVNRGRAMRAAQLSLNLPIKDAMIQSRSEIDNVPTQVMKKGLFPKPQDIKGFVLPLPGQFVFGKSL